MNQIFILRLVIGLLAILSLLAVLGYAFYRLITKNEPDDGVKKDTNTKPENELTEPSESALSISAQVEAPDNYEYMFDDCPNQTGLIFTPTTGMASVSVQECANKCSERSGCGAFYSTGCTTSKICDTCMLVSKEFKNIIPKSDIGRGLCTDYEEGDIKFYRKIA